MEEIRVARQLKKLRMDKGFTLEDVAKRTGFTKGLISKIENNKVSPPISTLARIAHALDVSLGALFSAIDNQPLKIVKSGDRLPYSGNNQAGQIIETLISGFARQKMESIIINIHDPESYQATFYSHPGQEFIFVLEGSTSYRYDEQLFIIEEGDSLYFDSDIPHGPNPQPGQKVRYLSVLAT